VSAVRAPIKTFDCDRDKPQDILDQLILAWERDDRTWLEQQLGPNAAAALDSLLNGRTWADMRGQLWPGNSNPGAAVGYRFQGAGVRSGGAAPPGPPSLEIDTLFKSAVGSDCGSYRVKFYTPNYLVDNQELEGLLRLIASMRDRSRCVAITWRKNCGRFVSAPVPLTIAVETMKLNDAWRAFPTGSGQRGPKIASRRRPTEWLSCDT
jgi:hypothetical protein